MSDNNTKTFYHDCGKGDRPRGTGWKNYYDNFDTIFGKKDDLKIAGGTPGHGMDAPPTLQVDAVTFGNIEFKFDSEGNVVNNPVAAVLSEGQKPNVG